MDIENGLINFLKNDILEDVTADINVQDDLLTTGLVDSLGLMRMVRYLEKELDILVPFEDITLENFKSVKHIIIYVNQTIS